MGMDRSDYVGPILICTMSHREIEDKRTGCSNPKHRNTSASKYCGDCGEKIETRTFTRRYHLSFMECVEEPDSPVPKSIRSKLAKQFHVAHYEGTIKGVSRDQEILVPSNALRIDDDTGFVEIKPNELFVSPDSEYLHLLYNHVGYTEIQIKFGVLTTYH